MILDSRVRDREIQRRRSLGAVFQRTNRLLTGDLNIKVNMVGDNAAAQMGVGGNVPGWSNYPDIFVNCEAFGDFKDARTLVQLLGLNYHELSHIMFSPRRFKESLIPKYRMAYNILEDQRIESLFTAMYQPAGKYFTEMVVKFIVGQESAWPTAFLWTHGRSFLPLEIREEFEERFNLSKIMRNKSKKTIDRYKEFSRADFIHNTAEVVEVIAKFADILKKSVRDNDDHKPNEGCGNPDPGDSKGATPDQEEDAIEEDKRRREEENETGEDQSGFWEEDDEEEGDDEPSSDDAGENWGSEDSDEEGDEGDEDSEGSSGGDSDEDEDGEESSDSGDGEGDDSDPDGVSGDEEGEGDGDVSHGSSDEGDGDGEVNTDGDDGGEAGDSDATSEAKWDDEELSEYLREIVEAVNQDNEVEKEVQRLSEAMNDQSNIDVIDFGKESHFDVEVGVGVATSLNQVTQHFRKLYAEVEPGWRYGSDLGRLNVGRAMSDPENYDEMFDEWDEGREHESGLEVFIALDISGSMGNLIIPASAALWMIKRACDDVEAHSTAVGFHSDTVGLYDRNAKASKTEIPVWNDLGGNTLPAQSFHLGRRVLSASDMPNKLFVIITDGGWGTYNGETGRSENLHDLIESIPGTRMYVQLGNGVYNRELQRLFHTKKVIEDPTEVVSLVEATITNMLLDHRR